MMTSSFVETREYNFFRQFCNACRDNRHIGLCHGPPGVGKTLSARYYANWDEFEAFDVVRDYPPDSKNLLHGDTILYTAKVINSPRSVLTDIDLFRGRLRSLCLPSRELHLLMEPKLEDAHGRRLKESEEYMAMPEPLMAGGFKDYPKSVPTIEQVQQEADQRRKQITDPTRLIIIDEADRLRIPSMEQVREIFDLGGIGIVLIGMPGIEKRLARYPQLYSRVGFVHEFFPLEQDDVRNLLRDQWRPANLMLPEGALSGEEVIAAIIRTTGGNFRILEKLLTQIAHILNVTRAQVATLESVEAARLSLVTGTE